MITRTIVASCDEPGCEAVVTVDPYNPQIYRALMTAGWSPDAEHLWTHTYCPDHHCAGITERTGAS